MSDDVIEVPSELPATIPADLPAPVPATEVTPAQAKVQAVANLTFKAYERASMLQLTPDEIAALQADFPDDAFRPGAAGKSNLIYIEHAFLRERLNQVLGLGQWAVIPRNRWAEPFRTPKGTEGSRVYVEAMLVIRGCFVAEAIGEMEYYPANAATNYGDAVEGAKTAALRRCCKELGVGLQAWKKDWCDGWWTRQQTGRRPAAPAAPAKPPEAPVRSATPKWVDDVQQAGKTKLVKLLTATADTKAAALRYFVNEGLLLDTEDLDALSPHRVFPLPESGTVEEQKERMLQRKNEIMAAIAEIMDKPKGENIEVPRDPEASWKSWPIPDWSSHSKQYKTFGELPKNLLWWWCIKWQPKTWPDKAGNTRMPSKGDRELRKMLDFVQEQYEFTEGREDSEEDEDS